MRMQTLLLSSAIAVMALGGHAYAQSTSSGQGAQEETTSQVGEIIVTSEKREQNLQDVPAAVSAFTSKDRDLLGINTIQDLTNFTPGLSYNTFLDRLAIRGIGRNTINLTADPGVATYVDGVYNAQTYSAAGDPLFVERIEVLRGPEGTLYGRNSIGGAVNSISRRPSSTFGGEVRGSVANYDRYAVSGTLTGPVTSNINFRLNGSYLDQQKGYFRNLEGGTEGGNNKSWYLEAQLQAKLGDHVDAWVKVATRYFDISTRNTATLGPLDKALIPNGTSGPGANYALCTIVDAANPVPCAKPPINVTMIPGGVTYNPANLNIRDFQNPIYNHTVNKDNYQIAAELVWHLPAADLKYIGGAQHYLSTYHSGFYETGVSGYDFPCAVAGCTPTHISTIVPNTFVENKSFWSNEFDLTSTGNGPLQWILGIYGYGEHYNQPVNYNVGSAYLLPAAIVLPYGQSTSAENSIDYYNTVAHGQSYAGFGQIDWKINDTLKLTAGLRYTRDNKTGQESTRQLFASFTNTGGFTVFNLTPGAGFGPGGLIPLVAAPLISKGVGPATFDPATGIGYRNYNDHWSAATGTLGLEWTPIADNMVYGKYSRGYKSGGFNTGFLSNNAETAPEFVDALEVGYKGVIAQQIRFDAAAFDYQYHNDQIPLSVSIPGTPAQTQFFNIPRVHSRGVEVEALWAATNRLNFILSYDYQTAIIEDVTVNGSFKCFQDGTDQNAVQPGANVTGCSTLPAVTVNPVTGVATANARSQNLLGQSLPQTPKNKVSFNMQYRFDLFGGTLTPSVTYVWKDQTYSSIFNRAYNLAPAYDQVDLRALWTDKSGKYTVIAYVKNVGNTLGYDNVSGSIVTNSYAYLTNPAFSGPVLRSNVSLTPPRTFGVELQHKF